MLRARVLRARVASWIACACLLSLGSACSTVKLIGGELALINDQKQLPRAIAEERDPERATLLREVPSILAFAEDAIGLRPGHMYRGYFATERKGMTYVLTASERFRLEPYTWWFPIAGTIEYRSYFDEADARDAQRSLEAEHYDTWVSPSRAYSTLGFLRDPVTTTMLRDGLPGLCEVLIHELAHARLYTPGHTDWNEALATFVGQTGAQRYFAQPRFAGTTFVAAMQAASARKRELDLLTAGAYSELERIYASHQSEAVMDRERQQVFATLTRAALRLYPDDDPELWRMNNARLLHFKRYSASSAAVVKLWTQSHENFRKFWPLAEAHARGLDE